MSDFNINIYLLRDLKKIIKKSKIMYHVQNTLWLRRLCFQKRFKDSIISKLPFISFGIIYFLPLNTYHGHLKL